MDEITKEAGLKVISDYSKERIETKVKEIAIEANDHLLNALYAESLLPAVNNSIEQYQALIAKCNEELAAIEARAIEIKDGQSAYNVRKEKKPIEAVLRAYEQGRNRMMERKANALEKINGHRFDAQAAMFRADYFLNISTTLPIESLKLHIANQLAPAAEVEAAAIIADEAANADVAEDESDVADANAELADTPDDVEDDANAKAADATE